jgi:hypothetical protein
MLAFAFVLAAAASIPEGEKPEPVVACTLESGEIVFQEGPCPVVTAKPAPPKAEPEPPPPPKPNAALKRRKPSTQLAALLEEWTRPVERPKPTGPPDPRFATPEKTWSRFLEAMRAGRRDAALECLAPGVELPSCGLADLDRAKPHGTHGDFSSLNLSGKRGRMRWILLERGWDGAWRIAAL